MSRVFRVSPQILLGTVGALADASAPAAARGASRALLVAADGDGDGDGSGASAALAAAAAAAAGRWTWSQPKPTDVVVLGGSGAVGMASSLAEAVTELSLAMTNAPGILPGNDLEPGDSSDDEEERGDGIRIRVRIKRGADDKWGVKWHKTIFQQSGRLVVDEITDGSILSCWNDRAPLQLRVSYGDRLIRVNGARADDSAGAKGTAKLRAELQKEEVRAVFWRPGRLDRRAATAGGVGSVLVCVPDGAALAPAAALAAAHEALYRPAIHEGEDLDTFIESFGEETAALLRAPGAESWLAALGAIRCGEVGRSTTRRWCFEEPHSLSYVAVAAATSPPPTLEPPPAPAPQPPQADDAGVEANGDVEAAEAAEVDEAAAASPPAAEAPEPPPVADDAGVEGARPSDLGDEAHMPTWQYSCRKCGTALFYDLNVLPHFTDGQIKASRDWLAPEAASGGQAGCTSVFVEPMSWMGKLVDQTGRLSCANPRCKQKLGAFSWHGLPCSCGQWQSPAFQIHGARLDCLPFGRRVRGPAPTAVFAP